MWRRIVAMKQRGVEMQIISWDYGALAPDRAAAISEVAMDHQYISLKRTITFRAKHMLDLLRYPWFAGIRWPGRRLTTITQSVKDFGPELIFLDGWHGALLAFHLRSALSLPIYYRAHNIEHEYVRIQHKFASTIRSRFVTLLSGLHLKSLEYKIMDSADRVYDISVDDISYWKARGYRTGAARPLRAGRPPARRGLLGSRSPAWGPCAPPPTSSP